MSKSGIRVAMLFGSMGVSALVSAVALQIGNPLEAVTLALVWTGRLAFFVFLIPFFASPLRALFKTKFTALLIRWRRNSGIAYGGIQVVHIFVIAWLFNVTSGDTVDMGMLVVGGFGLVLVMAMLVTSFDGPTRSIGRKNWKILHKSGFYICSFIYFYDFVLEPIELGIAFEYAPFAVPTIAAMSLRTFVMLKPKKSNQAIAA